MKLFGKDIAVAASNDTLGTDETRRKGRGGRFATLQELLQLLCDPISKHALSLRQERLFGADRSFAFAHGNPLLFPTDMDLLSDKLRGSDILKIFQNLSPMEQYCAFGLLKASGNNNNLDTTDIWYERHLYRATKLLADAKGLVLDIGCDDAFLSRGMLGDAVQYVGLEPSSGPSAVLRVAGLGEFLPFQSGCFDGVSFQTSLDHVFDYHLALAEARRVLKPGGMLYLATLLWTADAQLYTDTVHFHHFRPRQLEAALEGFVVEQIDCYGWKDSRHRFGAYLSASKSSA